jgi:WD40 repeat protein/tRNA A-37 threonylcarbamoyl transferase component Bud32
MSSQPNEPTNREQRFQDILVALVEASEAGRPPSPAELRARYPEFAEELTDFFADRKHLEQLAAPLRQTTCGAEPAGKDAGRARVRYFGDYELLEEIARGGMGVVYRARQVSLQRIVALKMILAGQLASDTDRQRFKQEAEAAANLDHPNIVPIYEVGEHEGQQYFSMKLIEGSNLAQVIAHCRLQKGGFRQEQVNFARIIATVARAVHHAHQRGVLHRDLKPANILLEGRGARDEGRGASEEADSLLPLVPMITDFGLAKRMQAASDQTRSGAVVGTPAYMAPEQARAEKRLSTAADVYSLGAILYELLTGRVPFEAATPVEAILQLLDQPPVPPRGLNPGVNRDLETICLKCLEKVPAQRYRSAEALAEDLERWLNGEPIRARPSSIGERAMKWAKRRPATAALLATAACFLCALLAGGVFILRQQQDLRAQQLQAAAQKAETEAQHRLSKLRLGQSLTGKARAERLAGNRPRALQLLAEAAHFQAAGLGEAARLEAGPELRQEAIQTVTSPGLRLLHEIPVGHAVTMKFSSDGRILAIHGVFGAGPGWSAGDPKAHMTQRLKVWRMASGELLGNTYLPASTGNLAIGQSGYTPNAFTQYNPFIPNSQSPLIAMKDPKAEKVRLWDPAQDRTVAELEIPPRSIVFSKDGRRLAAPIQSPKRDVLQVWDLGKMIREKQFAVGIPLVFISNDELATLFWDHGCERLQRVEVATGKQLGATPPGMMVLMVSEDGRVAAIHRNGAKTGDPVLIWDVMAGKELAVIPGAVPLGSSPFGAQFSPNGSYFAIDDPLRPNSFKLWDRATGRLREGLSGAVYGAGNFNQFQRAAFSPNAALLVLYAQKDRSLLHLWDVRGERRLATLPDNHTPVWSGDGRWLATIGPGKLRRADGEEYGQDRTFVRVWEVIYPVPATALAGPVETLAFVRDGKQLLANNRLLKVDSELPQPSLLISPGRAEATALLQTRDKLWALDFPGSPTEDRPLKLIRLTPPGNEVVLKTPVIQREPHLQKDVELVAMPVKNGWTLDHEGRRLIAICEIHQVMPKRQGWSSSANDRFLTVWDLETGEVRAASAERSQMECLALDPAEKSLATGDSGGVTLWNAGTLQRRQSLANLITTDQVLENWHSKGGSGKGPPYEYTFKVTCVRFSPDGRRLFAASASGRVDVYDVATGQNLGSWEGHSGPVRALAIQPDGKLLASGGEDRTIRLWEVATGKELACWEAHDLDVAALTFSPDSRTLASGGSDGLVKLWDLPFIQSELKALGLAW